jgi:3-amino-4-hydroxybenzoic acid synthase
MGEETPMTTAWLDLRECDSGTLNDMIGTAIEHKIEAVMFDADTAEQLGERRPGIKWVALQKHGSGNGNGHPAAEADVHVYARNGSDLGLSAASLRGHKAGVLIDVFDRGSLDEACAAVRAGMLTVVQFKDPTKIPLEIVLAAGSRRGAKVMTSVTSVSEAKVVMSVLESGPDGVIMAPRSLSEVAALGRLCTPQTGQLDLKEFEVTEVADAGSGDRVCVDTCSNFRPDEGVLVGSFGGGFLLCCSETHPLPYMPPRPFRVNAGAVYSYVLSSPERTNYLSELRQGDAIIGVSAEGATRPLVVGRAKIETRPLILVKARAAEGETASIVLQNDWHVRMLGPGGAVLNVTELKAGAVLLGLAARKARHVGMAIDAYCLEQ